MIVVSHNDGCIMLKGHAGYAEAGKDIVCAAVSALTQVFIASVEKLTTDNLKCDIVAGNAVIRYGNLTDHAQVLLDSFFIGIEMIASEYPDNVHIEQISDAHAVGDACSGRGKEEHEN